MEEGDLVFATYRDEKQSREFLQLKEQYRRTLFTLKGDVSNSLDVNNFFLKFNYLGKSIDILIYNAGIDIEGHNPGLEENDSELIRETYNINTVSMINVTKSLLPLLRTSERGAIVLNTSSGIISMSNRVKMTRYAYMMSKVAINMLTRIIAFEFKKKVLQLFPCHQGGLKRD